MKALDEAFEIGRSAGVPVVISHHKTAGRANFGRSRETLKKIDRAMAASRSASTPIPTSPPRPSSIPSSASARQRSS